MSPAVDELNTKKQKRQWFQIVLLYFTIGSWQKVAVTLKMAV